MKTSQLICFANQLTGLYMMATLKYAAAEDLILFECSEQLLLRFYIEKTPPKMFDKVVSTPL